MDKTIRKRFNADILAAAGRYYGLEPADLQELPAAESFIYAYERDGQGYILRLGHSVRRNETLIRGEVDWINYLAANGVEVACAVPSQRGRLVEQVPDGHGGQFVVTSFVRAPGDNPFRNGQWNEKLFVQYGRTIGRMHALSKQYVPDPAGKRGHWDDPAHLQVERWLPAGDDEVARKFADLMTYIRTFPQNRDTYGMIHQDAHAGNFFVDENGQMTLFDFDDCVFGHYVYDLAMVLFYAVTNHPQPEVFGRDFFTHFLRGYRPENTLPAEWTGQIFPFLKLREIDLYAQIHRIFDVDNLDNAWVAAFMAGRRERILNDVPYLALDWNVCSAVDSSIS